MGGHGMKVIVIGCTHAGTAAVVNIRALYKEAEIVVYERNDNISFLSCGIALNVGGVITSTDQLFYHSPEKLKELGIMAKMNHDVQFIDFEAKKIEVKDLKTGCLFEDTYDKLVLTLGSWPVIPKLSGMEYENIELCKNYRHALSLIEKTKSAKKVAVIGAGYIGVELAEAFQRKGKDVTLIDLKPRIMSQYLDAPFTALAEKALQEKGIRLALGEAVQSFEGQEGKVTHVVTDKGRYEADLVVMCIGFRPNTDLVKDKLKTLPNGAILIDEYMRTSQKDVFAGGDCCVVHFNPAEDQRYIPLATNAVRMGTLIAQNLIKPTLRYMGTQGTSAIKIYDYNIASTGLNEEEAKATTSYEVGSSMIEENHRPEFMPSYENTLLKLVFDQATGRVLGGQIASKYDVTELMNTLSVVIQNGMTVDELSMTDFFFQPWFNKPWGLLNQVALAARKN